MSKICFFRTDGSSSIGTGHIRRCLALSHALEMKGVKSVFFATPEATEVVPSLKSESPDIILAESKSINDVMAAYLEQMEAFAIVFDHYEIDANIESTYHAEGRALVAIDDLANRKHAVDLIFDMTLGRPQESYSGLVPPHCKVCCGESWQILRPEFRRWRIPSLSRRIELKSVKRVLLSLGGIDMLGLTPRILEALSFLHSSQFSLDIITGSATSNLDEVRAIIPRLPFSVRLLLDVSNTAELMAESDMAIGAGGTMTWERNCLGLPTLLLIVADNQIDTARAMKKASAAEILDCRSHLDRRVFIEKLLTLLNDPQRLAQYSRNCSQLCDGDGAIRVADQILDISNLHGPQ